MASTEEPKHYQIVEGLKVPNELPADNYRNVHNYQPKPGNLFICGYPRTGNTWLRQILYLISTKGKPPTQTGEITWVIPHLDAAPDLEILNTDSRVVAGNTHVPYSYLQISTEAKYIYVTRNVKDCMVSIYYFLKDCIKILPDDYNFNEFFEDFLKGDVAYDSYFDNVMSWYDHRNDENVLWLVYEEMKADPKGSIEKIVDFMGEKYSLTEEEIENVVKYSSFKFMFDNQYKYMDFGDHASEGELKIQYGDQENSNFIRKGGSGDWKWLMSAEQVRRLDEKAEEMFRGTDLGYLWK